MIIFHKTHSILRASILTSSFLLLLNSCGQDPSFGDIDRSSDSSIDIGGGSRSADSTASDDDVDNFGEGDGGVLGDVIGDGPADQSATDPSADPGSIDNPNNPSDNPDTVVNHPPLDPDDYDIPNVSPDEHDAIKKCMAKWGQMPFGQTINVKKKISVVVGGYGVPINDTQTTPNPELVLIVAGVNVGGASTYNLLNPNGWYCMMVNVNVDTNLDINLNCNARLADSLVNVNVSSTMSDDTARIGVHVNSVVTINTIRPNGQECLR